ncbi:MAG: AI-2 transport protein TqsA [Planctomycetota bacterium]|jgi:AI-2 transport protein TqsA
MPPTNRTQLGLLAILVTILVGWVLHVSASILQPLAIALLLASMLQPVVRGLARWHIPPVLTVVTLIVMLFVGLAQLGLLLQANVQSFIDGTAPPRPTLVQNEEGEAEAPPDIGGWDGVVDGIAARMQDSSVPKPLVKYMIDSAREVDSQSVGVGLVGSGFGFMKSLLLVLIYMVFIFAEQAVFRRKILSLAGDDRREETMQILDRIGRGVQRYLGVKTLVSFATGSICYAMLVYLQIPYAALFGLLTFLLNYIPTFGSIIAGGLATATALAVEPSWGKAVSVMSTYLAVNLSLGSFIEPRILGRELDLSPLVVIVSVVVWAGLWGVIGTFLAVPITSAVQIVLASNEFTHPVAVMLSSGPPKEGQLKRLLKKGQRKAAGDEETVLPENLKKSTDDSKDQRAI